MPIKENKTMTTENQRIQSLTFKEMIRARNFDKKKAYDDSHWQHIADYVTMCKRNDGDYLGVMRSDRRNYWNNVKSKAFVTYPVIMRALRSKTATSLATDIGLDIQPVLKLPEKKAGAELAMNVYKYSEENDWTERLETLLAMLGQIGKFAAILTEMDSENGLTVGYKELEKEGWIKKQETIIGCMDCGSVFMPEQLGVSAKDDEREADGEEREEMDSPDMKMREIKPDGYDQSATDTKAPPTSPDYDLSNATCQNPECGSTRLGISSPDEYEEGMIPTGEKEAIKAAQIKTTVISPMLIRYDDLHTIGFDWQKAHWFNYHPIETVYELIDNHPELEEKIFNKTISDWSDSTRWYYELTKSNGNLGSPGMYQQSAYQELVEADYWFYQPVMCNGWEEPEEFELIKNGKTAFDIKKGETIQDAMKRQHQGEDEFEFRGLMVKCVGDEITDVRNMSFLEAFTLIGWNLSVTSHVPTGEENLLPLQDAFTKLLSGIFSLALRASNPKGVVDGRKFNIQEFLDNTPGKWISTKQDMNPDEHQRSVTDGAGYIVPPNPAQFVMELINLLIQLNKELSGVYDETVGNANAQNITKGGRELALNQSLGLQAVNAKLKKEGKIAWTRLRLKLWQQMPDEAFVLIKGTFEEEWKREDVAAFKALDVDAELMITAVEGTDIPKTPPQQLQHLQVAAELGLLGEASPFEPEVRQYILKNALGLDFDIGNYEADRRLAGRRLEAMHNIADGWAVEHKLGYDQLVVIGFEPAPGEMPDPMNPEAPVGTPVRKLHPELLMTFAQDLRTKVRQEDNHLVFIGYYIDQIKGIVGSRTPKEVDVLILETAIDFHNQMVAQMQVQQLQAQSLAQNAMNPPMLGDGQNGAPNQPQPTEGVQ
jgi:hypothetical protein